MQLQTIVPISPASFSIAPQTILLLMGSCFAENIGEILKSLRFSAEINPFGIVYNPISLAKNMGYLLGEKEWKPENMAFSQELWHSFEHHSRFSGINKEKVATHILENIEKGREILQKADIISLTLGTAWAYRHIETGEIVANCHKIPARFFQKELLSVAEIVAALSAIFEKMDKKFLLTISPVRHWKEGVIENQMSKATLILAVAELRRRFGEKVSYFPAYEIMMDELRDYRFYAQDMLHPNALAIQYIWEKFGQMYFSEKTKDFVAKMQQLNALKAHRPFSTETESYRQLQAKIKEMEAYFSQISTD